MSWNRNRDNRPKNVSELEKLNINKRRRQQGVEFPSAKRQEQLLIIRFDISPSILEKGDFGLVRDGLKQLCTMFDEMDKGSIKIDHMLPNGDIKLVKLSEFNFTATIGFGRGFFEKLKISQKNCPKTLKEMPNNIELGDPKPYNLVQTDFIIQLCSNHEDVNRWVFQHFTAQSEPKNRISIIPIVKYPPRNVRNVLDETHSEIYSAIANWANIIDMHAGFQRIDGTNLLGFNDGISNPKRLSNNVVWTSNQDEQDKFIDGTYMVFQKIEHDLEKWRNLSVVDQENLIGRSKGTGLLLGTLSKEQDRKLATDMHSDNLSIRERSRKIWKKLLDEQKDPDKKFFDPKLRQYRNIQQQCPVWSHVRKSNPRYHQAAARHLIYRRGYLFVDGGGSGVYRSGLLFICFQKEIEKGFEHIKKVFLSNKENPNDLSHPKIAIKDDKTELRQKRRIRGYLANNEILNKLDKSIHAELASSSEYSKGQIPGTVTHGGGYYFIPPIPDRRFSDLSEQFFS